MMENLEEDRDLMIIRTKLLIMKDLMVRAPLFAVVVVALMGSMTYFFAWFTLYVIKPFILGE